MPRRIKSHDGNPYETIRGMWEIAYVSQFLRLFQNKLGTLPLNTQILEDALIDNSSLLVPDICARLLRYLTGTKTIVITNFEDSIQQLLRSEQQSSDFEPSRFNSVEWKDQNPEEKLGVLKWLVDHVYKEKEEELTEFLDDHYNADDLRGICAGQDAFNNVYWYLDDLRLYRENSWKKPSKKEWECVCSSLSDWTSFLKQFRKTTNSQERALYTYLNQEVFPVIEGQLQDLSNKQAEFLDNHPILDRERRELEEMLEKPTCNGEIPSSNAVNGNSQLHNGNVSDGGSNVEGFLSKPEEKIVNGDKNGLNMDLKSNALDGVNPQENCASANMNGPVMLANPVSAIQSRDNTQDGNIQTYPDNPSENSNKENVPAPRACVPGGEISPVSAMSTMVGSTVTPPVTTVSVQPLPSNIISKSNVSMETQYMQQQSQIFVFSTSLANKAAEVVISGQYSSIIGFHCAQPGTKRFLEKHPLKIQQFNRQNPAVWLNNLAQMKQGNRQIKPSAINAFSGNPMINHQFPGGPMHCTGPCIMHGNGPSAGGNWQNANMAGPPSGDVMFAGPNMQPNWNQQQMGHFPHQRFPNSNGPGMPASMQSMGPMGCTNMSPNNSFPQGYMNSGNMGPMNTGGPAGTAPLQGVKVPDENLTPQQRQHREDQLAMLNKMRQILFPDQHPGNAQPMCNMSGGHPRPPGSDVCTHTPMDPMYPHHHCDHEHTSEGHVFSNSPAPGMGPHFLQQQQQQSNVAPTSMAAQLEWQKLQQTFYEEQQRRRKPGGPIGGCAGLPPTSVPSAIMSPAQQQAPPTPTQPTLNSPSPSVVMSPGARMQGPPPPYHTGSRAPMQSPHPTSPSTLSLPSPHMVSGLASPADSSRQFSQPVQQHGARLPHPSPGTAGGGGSMHSTPLNSPKPSQGSNGGSLVRTPTTPNPIPTPTSTPSSSAMNSMLPSPSPTSSTGPGSVGSRKNRATPVTQHPAMVSSASQDGSLPPDFSPISQTASSGQGESFVGGRSVCVKMEPGTATGVGSKENLSLMPVPSPQQIQYLNTFDGQELTIQKQPNTSLRETDLISPGIVPPAMEIGRNTPQQGPYMGPEGDGPFMAQGPLPEGMQPRFPGHMDGNRFPISSPQMPGYDGTHRFMSPGPQHMEVGLQRMHAPHSFDGFQRMPGHVGMQPGMEGPMPRFLGHTPQGFPSPQVPMDGMIRFHSASETLQRFRGPHPHGSSPGEMMQHHRFLGPHVPSPDSHPHPQFPGQVMPGSENQQYSSPPGMQGPGTAAYDSHLQNLQKMTPPFDVVPNKISDLIPPLGSESPMNAGTQSTGSQRLSHFDPIASMAAMTEPTVPMVSAGGPAPNMMNMSVMQNSGAPRNQTNVVNFHTNMQGMHPAAMNPSQQQYSMPGQMSPNVGAPGGGPQTVNNTYVNATMSIQQLNIQNLTTSAYSPGMQAMNPHQSMMHQQMAAQSTHTVSSSTSNHPIMHSVVSPKGAVNVGMNPRGGVPFPNGQRPMLRTPGAPYNSANVQVKASAPNTIQYLPARPQGQVGAAARAPSLEFLQRFASPLTNLDSKVPTHNLQYFPSGGPNGATGQVGSNIPSPVTGSMPPSQGMMVGQRPMVMTANNMIRGPAPTQGMGGPNQVFSGVMGPAGGDPMVFGRSPGPVGSPVMTGSPMFPNKQTPLSPGGGMAPDSSQPLPSSMAHSLSYKQMPFYGPTTADPNYAVQFHNFQQQLYATNTRSNQMGSQGGMPSGTGFFGPK